MFAVQKAGVAEEAIPKGVERLFYSIGQRERYKFTEQWNAMKKEGGGTVSEKALVKWCDDVRAAARQNKRAQLAQQYPMTAEASPSERARIARAREDRELDEPWWPYLLGAVLGIAYMFGGAYLLYFEHLRPEHFDTRYWQQVWAEFSWRPYLPWAGADTEYLDGNGNFRPGF